MNTTSPAQDPGISPQPAGVPPPAGGMPLGARRLVLIGGLGIPVGLVAGPYLFGLQLIAVAGVVAVSVAMLYGTGVGWFSRWPRLALAAGAVWVMATAGYWLMIMAAAEASAPAPEAASVVFYVGVGAFAAMAAAVLAGIAARYRSRRRPVPAAG